jgi:hypothetical protein
MPDNQYNNTFNRGTNSGISSGYYSRTLFTWVNPVSDYGLVSQSDWIENTNGDGLQVLIDNKPEYCHGGITFPPYYWTSGKTIRFRGTFIARADTNDSIFNMRFGLKEASGPDVKWLAIQNNNNNHTFLNGGYETYDTPVNFQCLLMCCTRDYEGDPWFTANGFYRYNLRSDVESNGRSVVQVPVWQYSNGGSPNGVAAAVNQTFISEQTSFMMNCYNSDVLSIQLLNLTIEELL